MIVQVDEKIASTACQNDEEKNRTDFPFLLTESPFNQ